jgi:hypothetical protein
VAIEPRFEFAGIPKGRMIPRPFFLRAWLAALKRRDPPASACNRRRKHFANGIIPLLLCKTLSILL